MTLQEFIRSRGFTLTQVANQLNISRQAVADLENTQLPKKSTLEKLAGAVTELGTPTTYADIVENVYFDDRRMNMTKEQMQEELKKIEAKRLLGIRLTAKEDALLVYSEARDETVCGKN